MIPGRVRRSIERADAAVVARLSGRSTGVVSDCLNRMGAMDGGIRRLASAPAVAGVAVTVEEVEGGNLMTHAALELLQPGDVLVVDAKRVTSRAAWGGIQTADAARRGAVAIVVDGVVRDLEEVERLAVPVYARGVAPAGPLKGFGGNVNLPIACGGVVVSPGDVVVADADGVTVVPRELAAEVADLVEKREGLEEEWQRRAADGEATVDILGLREKLTELGVRFE